MCFILYFSEVHISIPEDTWFKLLWMRFNYWLLEQVFSYLFLLEVRKAFLCVRPCLGEGGGCGWEVTLAGCLCLCNYRSYPRQSVNNPLWCGLVAILTLFVSFKYIYLPVSTNNSTLCKNHPTSPVVIHHPLPELGSRGRRKQFPN